MEPKHGLGCGTLVLVLIIGLIGGLGGSLLLSRFAPAVQAVVGGKSTVSVETDKDAIVQAVKKISPAVVTINAISHVQETGPFGIPMGPEQARHSLGSGFFFEYSGKKYVMTNVHVIQGAQELTIRTNEGKDYQAKIVGESPQDLAVIEPVGVPADQAVLPLGDSNSIPVGSWVIAVGSPFGFDNTVTVGVVSRKGYTPLGDMGNRYLIQTDAAINSGNSGGPLLDLGGNVIGVNEMIFSPTQTNLGIGFAIPINQAKELLYFLVNRGPWVGVGAEPNSAGLARYFSLESSEGVVVSEVAPNSPAARAGLRQLDIILQVDSVAVKTPEDLQKAILVHKIGDKITFQIQRGKQRTSVTVQAGTIPEGTF
jgi:serine protease Do